VGSRYAAMTVNERLFASGHQPAWDLAVRSRDRARMIGILQAVDLHDQAHNIVEQILAGSTRYSPRIST
jgi:hypothetical protein